ncbi:unnamed protein product [Camellia sinensis]
MASNKGLDGRRDLIEAYVALQHMVSSMNYTCGVYIVVLHAALERFEATRKISRNPNPFKQQLDHLNRLVRDNDIDCHEQLRMNRHTFLRLCGLIRTKGVSDSKYVVLEEKVAMFLTVLGHHHKNRNVKFNFMRSGQTVSKYFNDVLKAVLRLQGVLLKTPEPITAGCTDDRWRWFQNCLGALDGTYVRVLAPAVDKARYRSRKGEIATNVLGVCSHDMQFIYVLPGWEGSASDSRVLRDAISRPNGLRVPTGSYYLVDAGYTNGEGFLAPYRGQRYHLSTWREGGAPTNAEEFFNMKHSAARNIIERCFGLLKLRWAILRTYSYFPINTQCRIITACCLLHNLIKREMPMDPLEVDLDDTLPNNQETGNEYIDTIEGSDQWSNWRDTLANQMYNEWSMDDTTATSGCRKKGKGKGTTSSSRGRRVWTPKECDVLIRAMRDLFSEKWKADNGQFRCGFYSELEKLIILAFPGTNLRASPHIESKIKFWRRQYNLLTDMLRLSSFGWDDSEKMILVDSDEVWQNYVKREPDAKGMRNVPFIYYEDWVILFGKDRATGVLAEGPADMVDALEKEDQTTEECYTPIVDLPDCSLSTSGTPCNQGGSGTTSKKRAREAEGIAKGLVDMAVEFGSFFKKTNTTMEEIAHRIGYAQDLSQARKLVNGELAKLRLNTNGRLRAATLIVKDAERVDLFFSLPEEEKMEWVCLLLAGCV